MIRLICLAVIISAHSLAAQVVSVRSGEHPGFSRLVLTQPSPSAWEFGRSETGYVFRMRGNIKGFDLTTVFDRISRNRLIGLAERPDLGLLALDLSCQCHAIATPFRPGIIVIDIADGPAPAESPFEEVLPLPNLTEIWTRPATQLRPLRRPAETPSAAEPPTLPPLGPRRLTERTEPNPSAKRPQIPDARAELLAEKLIRELSRGIASGALSAAQAVSPPATVTRSVPEQLVREEPKPPPKGAQINMRSPGGDPSREPPSTGVSCTQPEDLNLASWGDDRPARVQIAEARQRLITEFDRPDPAALTALVRLYLHLGFGTEARDLLAIWPLEDTAARTLSTLGALIDGIPVAPLFDGMQSCDGPAALWSILEHQRLPVATDTGAVLRSFSELPPWLRRDLGQVLSQRFLSAGDLKTVESLQQMMTRKLPATSLEAALISGQLDLAREVRSDVPLKLVSVAQSNTPLAPIALTTLLENKLERGEAIATTEITELEALVQTEKGSDQAAALQRTLARSLIAVGQVDRAFGDIGPQMPNIFPDLWALLAQHGSDADLLRLTLVPPVGSLRDIQSNTRQALADRLINAGFPSRALEILETLSGSEIDLARAKAYLALRDGRSALRNLAGADGPQAAKLRAEALEALADFDGAEQAWTEAGNAPRAARLRVLRQDWSSLPSSAPEPLQKLAASITAEPNLPSEPLARARAQITAASELRGAALNVMQDRQLP